MGGRESNKGTAHVCFEEYKEIENKLLRLEQAGNRGRALSNELYGCSKRGCKGLGGGSEWQVQLQPDEKL